MEQYPVIAPASALAQSLADVTILGTSPLANLDKALELHGITPRGLGCSYEVFHQEIRDNLDRYRQAYGDNCSAHKALTIVLTRALTQKIDENIAFYTPDPESIFA